MDNNKQIVEKYVSSILSRLTLQEKIRLLCGELSPKAFKEEFEAGDMKVYNAVPYCSGEVPYEAFIPVKFVDGPRGVVCGHSTCFPVTLARGATFDADLEERIGQAMAKEAKAYGGNLLGSVCVNIIRHLRGGRSQESYSEDMYHLGNMGKSLVKGIQSQSVMACVKHFACNNIENKRKEINVMIEPRTLHEVYLPHFKACIDAGAASVMGAYNRVNGKYCCENKELLTDVLREAWGFEGFTLSDFIMAIHDAAKSINAGLDLEMPVAMYYKNSLKSDVAEGLVLEDTINKSLKRLLSTSLMFYSEESEDVTIVACKEHRELAEEAARKSITLIKNEHQVLPLKKKDRVALFGSLASVCNLGDKGSSNVHPPYAVSIEEGLLKKAKDFKRHITVGHPKESIKEIKKRGSDADKVIVIVGSTYLNEGEHMEVVGGDRDSIRLSQEDQNLIKELSDVNDNIIVVAYGSGFIFTEIEDKVKSIIMAWYPGMEGGNAIADILYGRVNPSGKLPVTLPRNEVQMTIFDDQHSNVIYDYYHGYMLVDHINEAPAYPFGFGLSYTTFKYKDAQISYNPFQQHVDVSIQVSNVGKYDGDEVIQLYAGVKNSSIKRHKKRLQSYQRIHLKSGESKHVGFSISIEEVIKYYSEDERDFVMEDNIKSVLIYVGSSSSEKDLFIQEVEL